MKNNLGIYLKTLRKEHKMTQEYVASELHIIRQSYSHYETGRTTPTLETLCRLAKVYEVPVQSLIAFQLPPESADAFLEPPDDAAQLSETIFTFEDVVDLLPAKEKELINIFHLLSDTDQQDILDFIKVKIKRK